MGDERRWTWEDIVHLPEKEMPELIDGRPDKRLRNRFVGQLKKSNETADLRIEW